MFKTFTSKLSFLLLLAIFAAPVSRIHAQSTASSPVVAGTFLPDVVTGGDPEPPGEPDLVMGGDDDDVVTGGDPEPPGEPDGAMIVTALGIGTFIALRLS